MSSAEETKVKDIHVRSRGTNIVFLDVFSLTP